MKLLKILLPKILIIGIPIVIQIFIFVVTYIWLSESFAWINLFISLIGVLIFLRIINKDNPASFKLSWSVLILIIPIVGISFYITFGRAHLSKKQQKAILKETKRYDILFNKNESVLESLRDNDNLAYGQAKYLLNTSHLSIYDKCYNEYLKSGEIFFEKLKLELKTAKKYIFMEYFILEEGKMWNEIFDILKEKVKEGVEVHLMYDDIGSLFKIDNNFLYKLRNEGIYTYKFNPLKPTLSVFHNNRDHRKITVIDGRCGFISGINIADEYINHKMIYGKWKDNAIFLKGKCVDSLVLMFLQLYNSNPIKKLKAEDYFYKDHKDYDECGYVFPFNDSPYPIDNEHIAENAYLNIINQSVKYIYIYTPYLIVSYEFIMALINASKRGVDVHIITPHIADKKIVKVLTKSNYSKLIENGVKVHEYKPGFIHGKMIVSDDKYALIGTINFDYRSFVHHFECGVWCYNCSSIYSMKYDFEQLLEHETIDITNENASLSFKERIIKSLLIIFSPLM